MDHPRLSTTSLPVGCSYHTYGTVSNSRAPSSDESKMTSLWEEQANFKPHQQIWEIPNEQNSRPVATSYGLSTHENSSSFIIMTNVAGAHKARADIGNLTMGMARARPSQRHVRKNIQDYQRVETRMVERIVTGLAPRLSLLLMF